MDNTQFQMRKAERKQVKLRIGLSAPSGAGKTYSALKVARGLATAWEKICLIDTEQGSGEMYSHLGAYNVITLESPFSPERYIAAIKAAEQAGMEVIIIDSATHEWDGKGGSLESNELLAQTKFKGNTWAAWSVTTPRHQKFLEAITTSICDVITTARTKTDTIQTEDKKIKKVGMKEIQREGFEYELTLNFSLDRDGHYATASKDRTGLFIDRDPFVITEEVGKTLREWTTSGKANPMEQKREIVRHLGRLNLETKDRALIEADIKKHTGLDLVEENFQIIIDKLSVLDPIPPADKPKDPPVAPPVAPPTPPPAQPEPPKEPAAPVKTEAELHAERKAARATEPKPSEQKLNLFKTLLQQKEGIAVSDVAGQVAYLVLCHNIIIDSLAEMSADECDSVTKKLMAQTSPEVGHGAKV